MKIFLTLALAAALCTPAFAQKTGGSNRNAPMIKQSIVAGEAKMSLDYTSITTASGSTLATIMDKKEGAGARTRINGMAAKAPMGNFKTSIDVKCGDLVVPAGEYSMFFTIDEELCWSLNFMAGEKTLTTKLELNASEHESKRLLMCLYAGDDSGAGVYIAFGDKSGMLNFEPHVADKK